MPDQDLELDVFRDLMEEADIIGRLAEDEKAFLSISAAFEAGDRKAYQAILKEVGLIRRCELVCEWLRIKHCVLRCIRLCGPPPVITRTPNPRTLAQAFVRVTSDEKAVRRLAQAIEKGDPAAFKRIVREYKLEPICHLFCHWVCHIHYRLVCRWVCHPDLRVRPDLVTELQAAGAALGALLERKRVFDGAVAASNAGNAARLGKLLEAAGLFDFCHYICFFFCSWRCVFVCLNLCRHFPVVAIEDPIRESYAFAKVTAELARRPAELERLSAAVGAGDLKGFIGIVDELRLQRFCIQLCHWLCFLRCRRFCILVCPPIFNHPWFTHVGDFDIYGDIDPGTGLTNKAQGGHGGPDFGFFGCLKLRGFCPKYSPAFPGQQMAYRFVFQVGTSKTPITGGFVCAPDVLVGTRYTFWNGNPFALQSVRIRGTGTTSPTPPPPGPGLTPPDHYIVPDPQGWVTVDLQALDDGFNGWLMGFASQVGVPGGDATPPGLAAGTAVSVAQRKDGVDAAIIFQATRVSTIAAVNGGAAPDYTNQLSKIRIDNWGEVRLLDLLQFHSGGGNPCSPLSTDLDIEYTVDHELLADWHLELVTAAGMTLTAPPSGPTAMKPRGDAGTHHENISAWPTCSYAIRLHTRRRLTDGLVDDSDKFLPEVTFCIGRGERRPPR
jgi:hypothetical protein